MNRDGVRWEKQPEEQMMQGNWAGRHEINEALHHYIRETRKDHLWKAVTQSILISTERGPGSTQERKSAGAPVPFNTPNEIKDSGLHGHQCIAATSISLTILKNKWKK